MELIDYAKTLAAAGFEVWITKTGFRDGGYLTYKNPANGCWGTFQYSDFEGWQHLMPLKPSVEHGSHMFIQDPKDPWTVEAAEQCASPTNYNRLVGHQANSRAYCLSPKAVAVEAQEDSEEADDE